MPCSRSSTPALALGSRLAIGSSATMRVGRCASARAIATRCCCPPDSLSARRVATSNKPTRSRHSSASKRSERSKRRSHPRQAGTWPSRPARTFSSAVSRLTYYATEQRCLAGAARPKNGYEFVSRDGELDILDCCQPMERFGQPADGKPHLIRRVPTSGLSRETGMATRRWPIIVRPDACATSLRVGQAWSRRQG
jgi:hypothetical protein